MDISHYAWPLAAFTTGATSWFIAVLLVLTKTLHSHYSLGPAHSVQNNHDEPTPRIGGLAIFVSTLMSIALSSGESRRLMLGIVTAGVPAFAFGMLEDCTHRVTVRSRLFATVGSGILGFFVTGLAINDVNVPWLDAVLAWTPVAVLFTGFAVSGVANAFNIIDGFNGLASGCAVIMLSAMGLLSVHLGDVQLANVCLILAASVLGLLLVNWPFGKLFLGDGGAYFVGFSVAWVAVMLLDRHSQVSAFCPLLICAYPVLEVAFSVRRRKARRQPLAEPDNLHLHSVVHRYLKHRLLPNQTCTVINSTTGSALWAMALIPSVWALYHYDNTPMLVLGLVLEAVLYQVVYQNLMSVRRERPQWSEEQRTARRVK